jgi:NDP-sugar pyrophosphorylase family protein
MSTALTLPFCDLVNAQGVKVPLELNADPSSDAVHISQGGQPVGRLKGQVPAGFELQIYGGKGGNSLVLKQRQPAEGGQPPLLYFALPGGRLTSTETGFEAALERVPSEAIPVGTPVNAERPVQQVTEQAMILGAGIGTRILPLTEEYVSIAKPALPLDGEETVIGRLVLHLAKHGIKKLFVNTFYQRASVQQALQSASNRAGIELYEIPEHRATGTAGGLNQMLEEPESFPAFDPSQPLLIVQGDAVTNADFSQLLTAHAAQQPIFTMGCQKVRDEDVSKFGIVITQSPQAADPSGPMVEYREKPSLERAESHRLANAGFYVLSPQFYQVLQNTYQQKLQAEQDQPGFDGRVKEIDFANDLFPLVLQQSLTGALPAVYAQQVDGFWCDIGNPLQYYDTLALIYSGQVPFDLPAGLENFVEGGVFYWQGCRPLAKQQPIACEGRVVVGQAFQA